MHRCSTRRLLHIFDKLIRSKGCTPATTATRKASSSNSDSLYADLNRRIVKYRKESGAYGKSSLKHRQLQQSIHNLREVLATMEAKKKKMSGFVDLSSPSQVTLEVLSNGTTHLEPVVVIRTPTNVYLFNCPEGTARFTSSLKLKYQNIHDVFITRGTWDHIGGLSGLLLGKDADMKSNVRLHGPNKIKNYLEVIRPFWDSDFTGDVSYPATVEERTYVMGSYEDHALKVRYIPLFGTNFSNDASTSMPSSSLSHQAVDIAYLVELKPPEPKIDVLKLKECGIPLGPLVGKLKAGETVQSPDGRRVRPEEVYMDSPGQIDKSTLLVVECETERKFASLEQNTLLQDYMKGAKQMHYIVHFTPNEVFSTAKYAEWMNSFGPSCTHILLNGSGPAQPHMENMYRNQGLLNHIFPDAFPELYPIGFTDVITQDSEPQWLSEGVLQGTPLQRFAMRGVSTLSDQIFITLKMPEIKIRNADLAEEERSQLTNAIEQFHAELQLTRNEEDPFPRIVFLGTSSAVASRYRNVSSYLLQLSHNSAIIVDCGEGTYGQMKVLYGPQKLDEMLVNLKAVFITHAHQDHMNGLYPIILKRYEAFVRRGVPYVPLVLVCSNVVRKPMVVYSKSFCDVLKLTECVNIYVSSKIAEDGTRLTQTRTVLPVHELIPDSLFSPEEWNLRRITAVQVHHTRCAHGFVFEDFTNGRKIVFSGDTMPCDLLVEQGKGANVLIHESTFSNGQEKEAFRKKHSTMEQALHIGKRMEVDHIILTHFSARFPKVPELPDNLLEAGNASVAMDNMIVNFHQIHLLPKLLPIYRLLYQKELFEVELQLSQKNLREKQEQTTLAPNAVQNNERRTEQTLKKMKA